MIKATIGQKVLHYRQYCSDSKPGEHGKISGSNSEGDMLHVTWSNGNRGSYVEWRFGTMSQAETDPAIHLVLLPKKITVIL